MFVFGGCGSSRFLTRFSTRNGARAAEGPKSGAQLNDPMLFFSPEGDTPPSSLGGEKQTLFIMQDKVNFFSGLTNAE